MRKSFKKAASIIISAVMVLSLAACSGSGDGSAAGDAVTAEGSSQTGEASQEEGSAADKIVNIGVTDTLGSLNPLLLNGGEINKYATGLIFLPLMELDEDLNFVGMLADSVTTDDNYHFTVHIDDDAAWSDGTPVTAYDVEYTVLRLASPIVNNTAMMLYVFEGVGEDGYVEEGAESISGVNVIDDKTIEFTTYSQMSLTTFNSTYSRYILTLPKHIIEQFSEDELTTAEWFQKPDVISGPYFVDEYDVDHYIAYSANENYWKGAPKIDKLNINIVDSSQLYTGLMSGEIDLTQQTMSVIPIEDYESVEALDNVDVIYGSPVTNQSMFIQTANIPDVRVRQAMLCSIDRELILDQLLKGHGEIVDGFLSSASPFYDDSIVPVTYDPDHARELLEEAGWDGSQVIRFYVNSGDSTFVNAASVIAAEWDDVGIKSEITTVDFATLMSISGTDDYDVLTVQYTYVPVDPYPDVAWLLGGEGSWTGYGDEEVDAALIQSQQTSDQDEIKELFSIVDKKTQEDVPMISAYIISAPAAVSKRLVNASPNVYGTFNNVQEWDVIE